jgi:hypothetical protein
LKEKKKKQREDKAAKLEKEKQNAIEKEKPKEETADMNVKKENAKHNGVAKIKRDIQPQLKIEFEDETKDDVEMQEGIEQLTLEDPKVEDVEKRNAKKVKREKKDGSN